MDEPFSWHLRPAGIEDAEQLSLIGAATFLESFAGIIGGQAITAHCLHAHGAQAYRDSLADGDKAWIAGIEPGGAPIGYALLTAPDLPGAQAGDLELKRIYTLSRFHGGGLGAGLMQAAVDAATAEGAGRLLLGVNARNDRALAFYRKQGFARIAERQFNVGGQMCDDFVLARPLNR
ncbi:MAG: N-acetyltransferase family protein [Sphingobium sp.]